MVNSDIIILTFLHT